jgi:hypothetical protein
VELLIQTTQQAAQKILAVAVVETIEIPDNQIQTKALVDQVWLY